MNTNFNDVGDFHTKFGLPSVTKDGAYPRHPTRELLEMRLNFLLEELTELVTSAGAHFEPEYEPPELNMHGEGPALVGMRVVLPNVKEFNHEGSFDALIDLVYVALGTAHILGYPWQEGWDLVQKANMAKVRAKPDGSDSLRHSSFDVVKPEGWTAPDIAGLLRQRGWNPKPQVDLQGILVGTLRARAESIIGVPGELVMDQNGLRFEPDEREFGHRREGQDCAPEFCGGTRNDPCIYSPRDILKFEEMEKGNKLHIFSDGYTGYTCEKLYEDSDGSGEVCGLPAAHPIHVKETK